MQPSVAITSAKSNSEGAVLGIKNTHIGTIQKAINDKLRSIFKTKTWASVGFLIGEDERTTKHRLAGTRAYNLFNFVRLLRSEIGFQILKVVMGDPKHWPTWFRICVRQIKEAKLLTDMHQMQLLLERSRFEAAAEAAKLEDGA
jgi:hypothetical protein